MKASTLPAVVTAALFALIDVRSGACATTPTSEATRRTPVASRRRLSHYWFTRGLRRLLGEGRKRITRRRNGLSGALEGTRSSVTNGASRELLGAPPQPT